MSAQLESRPMVRRPHARLRAVSLLLLGTLAVHWLRYLLAYGDSAGRELHVQGHGYLSDLLPGIVAMSVALVVASLALRVLRGGPAGAQGEHRKALFVFSGCLLAIYGAQELAEGFLAPGHSSGPAALSANGGWVALPLAFAVGAVLAGLARLLDRAEEHVVGLWERPLVLSESAAPPPLPATSFVVRRTQGTLAFGFARRPPPPLPSI